MNRRTAKKVLRSMAAKERRYSREQMRQAMKIAGRDINRGRLKAWPLAIMAGLGSFATGVEDIGRAVLQFGKAASRAASALAAVVEAAKQ